MSSCEFSQETSINSEQKLHSVSNLQKSLLIMASADMSEFDSTVVASDQSSMQELCTLPHTPRYPAVLVIE